MKKPIVEHTHEIRVYYAQIDKMGIVHNARYLEYFEIGRTELVRNMGMSYKEVEEKGILLPVIETNIEFLRQAKHDDLLKIRSFITEIPEVKMKINYEIFCSDLLICRGYTVHAFVRSSNFRPTRLPDFFRKLLSGEKNVK